MFGRMMVSPVVQVKPDPNLEIAVAALLKATDQAEIVRWIEFSASVLLFLLVPGDPESGALYVLDRKKGTWYAVDFEDELWPQAVVVRHTRHHNMWPRNGLLGRAPS